MPTSLCFFGAGASVPFGIPTMARLVDQLEERLASEYSPCVVLYREIKSKLQDYTPFDIEALIRVLDAILAGDAKAPLHDPSIHYFSDWGTSFETMTKYKQEHASRNKADAEALLSEVKRFIAEACSPKTRPFEIHQAFFQEVLGKLGHNHSVGLQSNNPTAINYQIFTTNYDLVIESYFHDKSLPYECGQGQNAKLDIKQHANSDLYGKNISHFQIYKLHGSVNWYVGENGALQWGTTAAIPGESTLMGAPVERELMIYPAAQKYTFREPFYDMFHHLKQSLLNHDTCYIIGYSFRDDDILGVFHDALDAQNALHLCLIDPDAEDIVRRSFAGYDRRVHIIAMEFSTESVRSLS